SFFQDVPGVWASHRIHCVELHTKAALEKLGKSIEVKQLLADCDIILERIDYDNLSLAESLTSYFVELKVSMFDRPVLANLQRGFVNPLRDTFWRRTSVADVVLHSKIRIDASRIMTGRQDQTAHRPTTANHSRDRRS